MTGIPAAWMCKVHRAWEAIFIIETALKVLNRGPRVIRELALHGRFDLRLIKARMDEIRAIDDGPNGVLFPDILTTIEKKYGMPRVEFLGYIHPSTHVNHLRRVCAGCRLGIDNGMRATGRLYLPTYIRRIK